MFWRFLVMGVFTFQGVLSATSSATDDSDVRYIPLNAPAGASQAVVVENQPLLHTRQLQPLDSEGKLVGKGSIDKQVDQVLNNLQKTLEASRSSLDGLVRVNVYALSPAAVDCVRGKLSERLDSTVRPAITSVLTPLPHRDALVALDAVALSTEETQEVVLHRCDAVSGDDANADAAVLPRGGVAYLSGVPAEGGLTESAVTRSLAGLWKVMGELDLSPADIVQLKVFLRPASAADDVLAAISTHFPDQKTPPVVFVEWLAPPPVEIEAIARLSAADGDEPNVSYYNSPDVRPMQIFSRAALVRSSTQIFLSSLFASKEGRGQEQALDVFDQLEGILAEVDSDLRHLAKATYYVYDDDSARGMDRARLWLYDQDRPPAASKCMVHGMGQAGRTLTMDMIAVPAD